MRVWRRFERTDPSAAKDFKGAGGFSGTAIKPIYSIRQMTEMFGPAGIGWGTSKPEFDVMPGSGKEVLVYCTICVWYIDPATGLRGEVWGEGGDKIIATNKNGESSRDDARKAAFTDAQSNAFKHLGVSADIHAGSFDGSKYTREGLNQSPPVSAPSPVKAEALKIIAEIKAERCSSDFIAAVAVDLFEKSSPATLTDDQLHMVALQARSRWKEVKAREAELAAEYSA